MQIFDLICVGVLGIAVFAGVWKHVSKYIAPPQE